MLICEFSAVLVIVFAWTVLNLNLRICLNYRTHNFWNLLQIFWKHALYYHLRFWSNHLIWVLYQYCPNLHIAVLGFNVKYYNDSSGLMETESFMSVFYSLRSRLTAVLFSPQPYGQWMLYSQYFSWWQFDATTFKFWCLVIKVIVSVSMDLPDLSGNIALLH